MKEIDVESLVAGSKFSEHLFVDNENIIVPAKFPVKTTDIERLKRWNITLVRTEGEILADGDEDDSGGLQGMILQAFSSPMQQEVTKQYAKYSAQLKSFLADIDKRNPPPINDIKDLVDEIALIIENHKDDVIQYILYGKQGESNEVENAINATILSILIGMEMNLPAHKLLQLAASAILRDCGMLRVPGEISRKKGSLSSEELQQIKTHPVHSYRIITKEIGFSEDVGISALQHQERWDGKGYPKAIKGTKISLFARIISVADAFEAMISQRPHRNAMIGYNAMRTILGDNGSRFDPEILKVFIRTLGIYPIGSIVLLNNSCIGRVIENRPDAPLHPKIKLMINEKGFTYLKDEGAVIDLASDKSLFIARALDPKTVQERPG